MCDPAFVTLEKGEKAKKSDKILGCMKGYDHDIPYGDQIDKWEVQHCEAAISCIAKYYKKQQDQGVIAYDHGGILKVMLSDNKVLRDYVYHDLILPDFVTFVIS